MSTIDPESIMASVEAMRKHRAEQMPTEQDAIRTMFSAWQRLKELGWKDGRHMPATGERFAGIQCGSTGIHAMTAERNEAPFGRTTWTAYDGDIWPSSVPPVLFRPWKETDVQPNLRPCYPMQDDAHGVQGDGNVGAVATVTLHGVTMPAAVWERIKDGVPPDYTEEEFRAYSAIGLAREQAARGVVEVRRTEYTPGGMPITVVEQKPARGVIVNRGGEQG